MAVPATAQRPEAPLTLRRAVPRRACARDASNFVYVTPEFLTTRAPDELAALQRASNFCCVALDEAHYVADMGRTYPLARLHEARAPGGALAALPWVAVTATATPAVQARSAHSPRARCQLARSAMRRLLLELLCCIIAGRSI
jgi:superfamily II DNA helicase RecQ